ncbi:MAG: hypothetical protein JKY52_09190 [Flavobacteriales bacterium]|nr:hypothetical protein [Flavobacteriales bacterium]
MDNKKTLEQFEKLVARSDVLEMLFKIAFEQGYARGHYDCNYRKIENPDESWSNSAFKQDLDETLTKLSMTPRQM